MNRLRLSSPGQNLAAVALHGEIAGDAWGAALDEGGRKEWSGSVLKFSRSSARPAAAVDARMERAVKRHLALVWRVLRRAGLRPADSDDATQDAFWVLAQRVDQVPEAAQRSFLVTTALRIAADRRRSAWARSVTEPLDLEACDGDSLSPDEVVALREGRVLLDEALDALDAADRAVFLLVELEQMSRTEVAEILELPPGTVASRLKRARETFSAVAQRLQRRTGRSG